MTTAQALPANKILQKEIGLRSSTKFCAPISESTRITEPDTPKIITEYQRNTGLGSLFSIGILDIIIRPTSTLSYDACNVNNLLRLIAIIPIYL